MHTFLLILLRAMEITVIIIMIMLTVRFKSDSSLSTCKTVDEYFGAGLFAVALFGVVSLSS